MPEIVEGYAPNSSWFIFQCSENISEMTIASNKYSIHKTGYYNNIVHTSIHCSGKLLLPQNNVIILVVIKKNSRRWW